MDLKVVATVVNDVSKKTNNPYTAIKIVVYDEQKRAVITKMHFPTLAEKLVLGID